MWQNVLNMMTVSNAQFNMNNRDEGGIHDGLMADNRRAKWSGNGSVLGSVVVVVVVVKLWWW